MSPENAEILAFQGLGWLAGDAVELEKFLHLSGLDAAGLRQGAGTPEMSVAILDYLLGHEELLLRFCGVLLTCTGRSLACKVTHTPEQRLAKWLLLARDRTIGDELPYTQETLARMLGVRRPTVSEAAEALKERGLIEYHRGLIQVSLRERAPIGELRRLGVRRRVPEPVAVFL